MPSTFDRCQILVKAGNGGNGAASFRREKFVPHGGPDGGDGGRGGSVFLVGESREDTLLSFRGNRRFAASHGEPGMRARKTGARGKNALVPVPLGTVVSSGGEMIGEVTEAGQKLLVARGGMGGWGNARFATAADQAPRFALRGEPGEERWLDLELKLIADIGLIGYPNAGKSSFLAASTRATPRIANYPFTTLQPNLGVAEIQDRTVVLADLPGLIEGASRGVGLGLEFLRHAERTALLLHIVDGAAGDPVADYRAVEAELKAYGRSLPEKPRLLVVNKMDLPEAQHRWPELQQAFGEMGIEAMPISALTGEGVGEALAHAISRLPAQRQETPAAYIEEAVVYRPAPVDWQIEKEGDAFRVRHLRLERLAAMVDPNSRGAVEWYRDRLARLGVASAVKRAGAKEGDMVRIGALELEW